MARIYKGRKADLPKIEESHKDLLFAYWDTQLKQAKRATVTTASATNSIIEVVNENLHSANLVKECIPRALPDIKQLEQQ